MAETEATDRFVVAIKRAIEAEIGHIVESEIEETVERVKRRVREKVGSIAGSVFSEYSMRRNGPDVLITVKFDDRSQ